MWYICKVKPEAGRKGMHTGMTLYVKKHSETNPDYACLVFDGHGSYWHTTKEWCERNLYRVDRVDQARNDELDGKVSHLANRY